MADRITIDEEKPLSQSLLWEIQRHYFLQAGIDAWADDVVPHHISCSPYLARAYAHIILGYMRDFADTLDPAEPLYVVELGAGSGRLSFHLLHQLLDDYVNLFAGGPPLIFVLTDFVPGIIDFWRQHPKLQPWIEQGVVDFSLFDAVEAVRGGNDFQNNPPIPKTTANPLIVLANYFFDSIPADSYTIRYGRLYENRLTLTSSRPEPNVADPTLWDRLELHYQTTPAPNPPTANHTANRILHDYEAELPDTTITFPTAGLACLDLWRPFGGGRQLWLTSDRGYTLPETLAHQTEPLPNLHGSFSLMVNYHALAAAVLYEGGQVLHAPHYQNELQTLAFVFGGTPDGGRETALAFEQAVIRQGPDDFFALKRLLEDQIGALSLPEILSFLRLSGFDGQLFSDHWPIIWDRVQAADPSWYPDVAQVVEQIAAQHLPLRPDDPLENQVAQLMAFMLGEDEESEG